MVTVELWMCLTPSLSLLRVIFDVILTLTEKVIMIGACLL